MPRQQTDFRYSYFWTATSRVFHIRLLANWNKISSVTNWKICNDNMFSSAFVLSSTFNFQRKVCHKKNPNMCFQKGCEIVRKWLFTLQSVSLHQVQILEQLKGSCVDNLAELGRNHYFPPHWTESATNNFCTKLAPMQKSSILFRIDQSRVCFRPLAYCLQQRLCEMTRHVMWPHSGQHLWASSESTVADKWVCGDEQLMEWLAKVMMVGEAPFCSLISIWTNTTFCKCLITSAKGQPGGTWIHHLGSHSTFSISLSSNATCWLKQHWLKKGTYLI